MENKKFVEFDRWCPLCKYKDAKDNPSPDIPCDECLEVPARENSTIPDRYDGPLPTKHKDKDGKWVIDDPSLPKSPYKSRKFTKSMIGKESVIDD